MEAQLFQASNGRKPAPPPPAQLLPQDSELTSDPGPARSPASPSVSGTWALPAWRAVTPRGPREGQPLLLGHHLLLQGPSLTMWPTLSRLSVSPQGSSCFMDALRVSPAPEVTLWSHLLVHWLSFPPSASDAEPALCFSLG